MSFYTNWFLAVEKDAKAVASIVTTEERSFVDWPHLSMKSVSEMDLSALWGILRGDPDSLDTATGELLFEEAGEIFVCRVEPKFVEALASVQAPTIKQLAIEWNKYEGLSDWNLPEATTISSSSGGNTCNAVNVGAIGQPKLAINLVLRASYSGTAKSATNAFWVFLAFYVVCAAVTFVVYLRRPTSAPASAAEPVTV